MRGAAGRSPEAEFVEGAARLARDQVARRANETVIHNVGRDRARGARFARVPMGAEPCAFCTMLASRGFVYHTEETAGEFDHFHGSCRCKVVPGFPTMERYVKNGVKVSRGLDPGVEGYDPDRYFDMYRHPEKYAGKSVERDATGAVRDAPGKVETRWKADESIAYRRAGGRRQSIVEGGKGTAPYNSAHSSHKTETVEHPATKLEETETGRTLFEKVRTAKHRSGSPYTEEEKRIAQDIELNGSAGSSFKSVALEWTGKGLGRHVNRHGEEFGLDPSNEEDRNKYKGIANDTIDNFDALTYGDWAGQKGQLCLFYFKGDKVAIVNAVTKKIVSVFKFKRGRNEQLDAIWDSVHE